MGDALANLRDPGDHPFAGDRARHEHDLSVDTRDHRAAGGGTLDRHRHRVAGSQHSGPRRLNETIGRLKRSARADRRGRPRARVDVGRHAARNGATQPSAASRDSVASWSRRADAPLLQQITIERGQSIDEGLPGGAAKAAGFRPRRIELAGGAIDERVERASSEPQRGPR